MTDAINVFNRDSVRRHRERAASDFAAHDFLHREVAERLLDRLDDVTRRFPLAADIGCRGGLLGSLLAGRGGIETIVGGDMAPALAAGHDGPALVMDEEALPFADGSLDLVLSNLGFHWINDLPGALVQIRRALKPDGLLLASMFGGETLKELRHCLGDAELEIENGLSPRVSPFADIRDIGSLMQRAGFALPVLDAEIITVSYADPLNLMRDLRGMGESNAVNERRRSFSRRTTIMRAMELYLERYRDPDGRVHATFDVIFITAWAPAENQQKPARRGSADVSLADVLTKPANGD
ncbi:MAG: methyltransferase domain-containing protein [Rhodospirillales bacterium]